MIGVPDGGNLIGMTPEQARQRLSTLAQERQEILNQLIVYRADPSGLYSAEYWRLREKLALKDTSINEVRDWYMVGTLERLEGDTKIVAQSSKRLEQFTFTLTFVTILLFGSAIATLIFQYPGNPAATIIAVLADIVAITMLLIVRSRLRHLEKGV
jgi:hypothetical protein